MKESSFSLISVSLPSSQVKQHRIYKVTNPQHQINNLISSSIKDLYSFFLPFPHAMFSKQAKTAFPSPAAPAQPFFYFTAHLEKKQGRGKLNSTNTKLSQPSCTHGSLKMLQREKKSSTKISKRRSLGSHLIQIPQMHAMQSFFLKVVKRRRVVICIIPTGLVCTHSSSTSAHYTHWEYVIAIRECLATRGE